MSGDVHVRFCERLGVRLPRATHRNIYVRSRRAGERVMESVRGFLDQKLKLKVNPKKSRVEHAQRVTLLGFICCRYRGEVRIRMDRQALKRFRAKMRRLTKRTRPGKLEDLIPEINTYLMGWIAYFQLADTPSVFAELDGWLRRRLRQLVWKRWKRGTTRYRELVVLGVPRERAALGAVGKSPWRMARSPTVTEALSNAYWLGLGLLSISARYRKLRFA